MRLQIVAVAVVLAELMAGCAARPRPQYESRMVPFGSSPTTNADQVKALCLSQAELAGMNARTNAQAAVGQYQAPAGFSPVGTVAQVFDQRMSIDMAASNAYQAVLNGCLAQYGWRIERYCVQNCR